MPRCAKCGSDLEGPGPLCARCGAPQAPLPPLEPALYTRVYLLLKRGEREEAVQVVMAEAGLDRPSAEAAVDGVRRSREEEVPPLAIDSPRNGLRWYLVAVFALVVVLGWLLLVRLGG